MTYCSQLAVDTDINC